MQFGFLCRPKLRFDEKKERNHCVIVMWRTMRQAYRCKIIWLRSPAFDPTSPHCHIRLPVANQHASGLRALCWGNSRPFHLSVEVTVTVVIGWGTVGCAAANRGHCKTSAAADSKEAKQKDVWWQGKMNSFFQVFFGSVYPCDSSLFLPWRFAFPFSNSSPYSVFLTLLCPLVRSSWFIHTANCSFVRRHLVHRAFVLLSMFVWVSSCVCIYTNAYPTIEWSLWQSSCSDRFLSLLSLSQ